jgi:uncharacterized protein YecT (DUF1311 family)
MSRYFGRMIKGKLDGPISNQDSNGNKFRGTFVNGVKSTDWTQVYDVPATPAPIADESLELFLKRKDAEITSAYQSCLASFQGSSKEQLRIAQRAWIEFSNKDEAAAGLAGSRRGLTHDELVREAAKEVEARTQELRSFFTLPNQDIVACQRDYEAGERDLTTVYEQVLVTLARDEQEKLQEAERSWRDFQQKSANSHLADASGRAPVWDRVVIGRRRTEELREFYLHRLAGQGPPSVPTSPLPTAAPVAAAPVAPPNGPDQLDARAAIEAELTRIEDEWESAYARHDPAIAAPFLSDTIISLGIDGRTRNKTELLADIADRNVRYTSARNENVQVHLQGPTTALVTGVAVETGTDRRGKAFNRRLTYADRFSKIDGRWQCTWARVQKAATPPLTR